MEGHMNPETEKRSLKVTSNMECSAIKKLIESLTTRSVQIKMIFIIKNVQHYKTTAIGIGFTTGRNGKSLGLQSSHFM